MIYFDNAATTRPDAESVSAAQRYLNEDFFNPSALYREGFEVHRALNDARRRILACIAPQGFELIFTGSGTEADNQVIFSAARRGNFVTTEGNTRSSVARRSLRAAVWKCGSRACVRTAASTRTTFSPKLTKIHRSCPSFM